MNTKHISSFESQNHHFMNEFFFPRLGRVIEKQPNHESHLKQGSILYYFNSVTGVNFIEHLGHVKIDLVPKYKEKAIDLVSKTFKNEKTRSSEVFDEDSGKYLEYGAIKIGHDFAGVTTPDTDAFEPLLCESIAALYLVAFDLHNRVTHPKILTKDLFLENILKRSEFVYNNIAKNHYIVEMAKEFYLL